MQVGAGQLVVLEYDEKIISSYGDRYKDYDAWRCACQRSAYMLVRVLFDRVSGRR